MEPDTIVNSGSVRTRHGGLTNTSRKNSWRCKMHDDARRNFLLGSSAALASGVFGLSVAANASEQMGSDKHMMSQKGVSAFVVSAKEEGICATCRFWGGIRRASEDKQTVSCESLGWCNNPESHHYQSMTTPATGPMKRWQKWEAL